MITYVVCDLFLSPAHVLVNTVNTVGVMGKGIAKDFKQIYPAMFREYQELCEKGWFDVGQLWLYRTPNKWMLNFPTKRHWRQPSRPEYIEAGLKKFVETYHVYGITSISFPLLGCGNGELDWETQVQPIMEQYLKKLPLTVFIHLLQRKDPFIPEHRDIKEIQDWLRGEPESLAFTEVWDDLCSLLKDSSDFCRLDTGEGFRVKIDSAGEGMILEIKGRPVSLPQDALMDLWQQIRASGFLAADSMPCGLDAYASYVVSVMSNLPYLKPVEMANQYRRVTQRTIGLRLQPRPLPPELPLLTKVGAVEPE
jgi:O-acetyl-ADP-ribose deacetylase (regulator of RNase III)